MNFSALTEKLRDQFLELWGRIQETSIYMSLREKYESMNPRAQSAILAGGSMLAVLFVFSFPYSYISESRDYVTSFEENRELIRDLLKASKTLKEPSPLPPGVPPEALSQDISRALEEFHLVQEQVTPAQPTGEKVTTLVPEGVRQTGVILQLKKLNVKQIVEISHRLETLSPGVKMMGLEITENTKPSHYFDVTYKLASFSVDVTPPPAEGKPGGKGGRPPPTPKPSDEEAGE